MFYIILIVKINVARVMILKLFKFDIIDLRVIVNEIYKIIFIKDDFSKRRRNCIMII